MAFALAHRRPSRNFVDIAQAADAGSMMIKLAFSNAGTGHRTRVFFRGLHRCNLPRNGEGGMEGSRLKSALPVGSTGLPSGIKNAPVEATGASGQTMMRIT
ncbi:hypothetical protein [Stenotrophomonas sp. CFBP 13725]|uniref:hypothetical protein n=1 Tax=Stenotrophomonas sp. CFBP 13725 TaxID=2775297 RepID=UPI0018D6D799|nr:hypothetical protein [Stenotrophomonas sp. CFBP 13725]